jgi:thioredoxin-related protein
VGTVRAYFFKGLSMKAIGRWRLGVALSLAVAVGIGLVLRADDQDKKEPAKEIETKEKLWIVDFDDAKATAAKAGKDILMEFTGSDWCPPCMALKREVFDQEVFQAEAPKHFVLLKLDSPRDTSKQTEKEIEQNKTLNEQFKVEGFPTIILADAAGKPYAKMVGYGRTKAEEYTKNLVEKTAARKKRDDFLAQAKDAKGLDRAKLLAEAISGIDDDLALETYRDTVDEIVKLDAENKAGLKAKYEGLVRVADVKNGLNKIQSDARANQAKPADVVKKVDGLIAEKKPTGELLQDALYLKAVYQYGDDREGCRKTLEEAIAAAPDTERAKQIQRVIDREFKKDVKKESKPESKKE